jgi:predicted Zn-dependent protease
MGMKKLNLCLLVVVMLSGCAKNPVTGKRQIVLVSEGQEIAMGAQSDVQVRREYGVVENVALQQYVQSMGEGLAAVSHRPGLSWHFTVVNSPVVNAFAIPGGYIYLTRGILAYLNNEAELAGVMGHEIGHVTARHSVQQITRQQLAQVGLGIGGVISPTFGRFGDLTQGSLNLVFLRFSRDNEREADRLGVEYAARAGYDPREISNFFDVLSRLSEVGDRETIPGWLSTHPDPPERVTTTRELAQEWVRNLELTSDRMTINRDAHLRAIDGIVYGDNPREGFVEGRQFYHPELQFQIMFPAGWQIENTQSAVLALDPKQMAQIQLTLADVPDGTTADDYVRRLEASGTVPQSSENVTINGHHAVLGNYSVRTESGTLAALAGFIEFREKLIQIVGITNDFRAYRSPIEASIRSFDRITEQRILNVQPDRLKIYTAAPGDTVRSISSRLNNPRVSVDQLGILNRMAVDAPITPGRLIKTVEPGY